MSDTDNNSEIARIVAADLSADYGPNQRSDAGDLARLVGLEGRVRAVVGALRVQSANTRAIMRASVNPETIAYMEGVACAQENAADMLSAALRGGEGDVADGGTGQGAEGGTG